MSLRFEPSHHVVDRGLAETDGDSTLVVDNAVAAVALDFGDEFRVRGSPTFLAENDPVAADALTSLSRVDEERKRRLDGGEEWDGSLPTDRETVERLLDFERRFAADTDAWVARLHGIDEFAVFGDGDPLYRSIPHETFIRELDDATTGFVDAATDAVSELRGVAVLPVDPLVTWTAAETGYELNAEILRIAVDADSSDHDGHETWRWFGLSDLVYVRTVPERDELALQWREANGTSLLERGKRRFTRLFRGDPPTRLSVPETTLDPVTETFVQLRESLDYEYRVDAE
ncbi:hypothetical protein [Haloprofundus marisrubri]|uniref:hypothetical protein n=1 Tax=Haloprofundus marisrubri TaxID=1514971 RepID=UPI0012BAA9BA|nr:hypothetical protein [Haloprofundus marisrubri]